MTTAPVPKSDDVGVLVGKFEFVLANTAYGFIQGSYRKGDLTIKHFSTGRTYTTSLHDGYYCFFNVPSGQYSYVEYRLTQGSSLIARQIGGETFQVASGRLTFVDDMTLTAEEASVRKIGVKEYNPYNPVTMDNISAEEDASSGNIRWVRIDTKEKNISELTGFFKIMDSKKQWRGFLTQDKKNIAFQDNQSEHFNTYQKSKAYVVGSGQAEKNNAAYSAPTRYQRIRDEAKLMAQQAHNPLQKPLSSDAKTLPIPQKVAPAPIPQAVAPVPAPKKAASAPIPQAVAPAVKSVSKPRPVMEPELPVKPKIAPNTSVGCSCLQEYSSTPGSGFCRKTCSFA
ncbi:hypothetical protein [Desulfamplus magnetovallimortis]|uniref:hypothetical protein n=1 Tax=Desulfamplus magnetovallimortis TaxID=1246637 RepID=UPI001645A107|nr:hypothetical protein [Desulfamplus magnetovallimortis]